MTSVPILLIDDDEELCASLCELLSMEGFVPTAVHDARTAAEEALRPAYKLVVLDIMLPGGDGREVLRSIRTFSSIPVIMLTARGDQTDRISGLEAGADDYLPKPFNPRELVARMRAVLRRKEPSAAAEALYSEDLAIHVQSRRVLQNKIEVQLTSAEFDILLLLVRSAGKTISRDELTERVLGRPLAPFDRSIDNHVSNLRKKLGMLNGQVERFKSVRGAGYLYTGELR